MILAWRIHYKINLLKAAFLPRLEIDTGTCVLV